MVCEWYVVGDGVGHWPKIAGDMKLEQGWIHRQAEDTWMLYPDYCSNEPIGPFPTLESAKAAHAIIYL